MRRRNALLAAVAAALMSLAPLAGSAQAARPEAAAAARMQEGRYLIVSENPEVGKLDFAPFSVPTDPPSYVITGSHRKDLKEQWTVTPAGPGAYTLNSTTHPGASWSRHRDAIVASEASWSRFAIEPAGGGTYRIHVPNEDAVATLNRSDEQLHVEPDQGSPAQRWRFVRVAE
ncbi:hypothetical protein ADL22_08465 [Streptomyces sp. NRRL F-4489]|uniref:RICIN domain-containing protein n=1 Tax=Streptomyces sp. NRRL F-4489 TaxID=1609095 RepID=UPI0007491867|nr:RICIN domain-containing protein [Streptomyces sp. NRRL F-4489]KUL49457.1 hypothetical protein ADL22_08465 [Streptomyces sp. NRRL F-4489]